MLPPATTPAAHYRANRKFVRAAGRAALAARTFLVLGLGFPALLAAQSPAVSGVFNQVSRGAGLSPGVLAAVRGAAFGKTPVVTVDGRPAAVLGLGSTPSPAGFEGEEIQVQLPVELAPGPATLVVTTSAGSSAPFGITLEPFAPALLNSLVSCKPGQTIAPSQTLKISAVGLGPVDPPVPTGATPSFGNGRTVTKPEIVIGGQQAEVIAAALSAEDVGLYEITLRVPPAEGGHDLVLSIGGVESNRLLLPIGRSTLNLSSASYRPGPAAPESIRTTLACGVPFIVPSANPNTPSFTADTRNPPTELGGVTVRVTDANGAERLAPLLYVDPLHINYVVPAGTAAGYAKLTITGSDGADLTGTLDIRPATPALFGAGLVVRVREGEQTVEPIFPVIAAASGITGGNGRIDLGPASDTVYLVLYGSGLRFRSSLDNVSVKIGGVDAPVEYAGAQTEFAGLDQVNVRLPRSLAGRGNLELELRVDGVLANIMFLSFP